VASLTDRVARWMNSPQGRKVAAKAQELARDPKNRERLTGLRDKLRKR
jgi:hypothetical protein